MVPDWGASGHGEECEVGPGVHWCKINKIFVKEKKNLTMHEVTVSKEKVYMTFLVRFWSINVFKSFWSFFLNLCQGLSFILTPFSLSCFICLTPDFLFFFLNKTFPSTEGKSQSLWDWGTKPGRGVGEAAQTRNLQRFSGSYTVTN